MFPEADWFGGGIGAEGNVAGVEGHGVNGVILAAPRRAASMVLG